MAHSSPPRPKPTGVTITVTDLRTHLARHLEVGVPAKKVEKIARAVALTAHSSTCRIARDHGKVLVEVPKPPEEQRKLDAAAVERFTPSTSWHVALGLSITGQPVWYDLDTPGATSPTRLLRARE